VEFLQEGNKNTVYAVCCVHGVHGENTKGYYKEVMKSWGVLHLPIKYYRFLSVRKDIVYMFSLYKILRKEKFDMVINIATKANVYGSILAKLIGTKKITCSVWGLGVNFADEGGWKRKLFRKVILCCYRIGFHLSDKIWFTNEFDFNWFVSDGIVTREKAFLTKNYVNTETYSPNSVTKEEVANLRKEFDIKGNNKVVVMVARMSWAK